MKLTTSLRFLSYEKTKNATVSYYTRKHDPSLKLSDTHIHTFNNLHSKSVS